MWSLQFKSSTLVLSGFVLGSSKFNSLTALCKEPVMARYKGSSRSSISGSVLRRYVHRCRKSNVKAAWHACGCDMANSASLTHLAYPILHFATDVFFRVTIL